jgi:hypothetical protein
MRNGLLALTFGGILACNSFASAWTPQDRMDFFTYDVERFGVEREGFCSVEVANGGIDYLIKLHDSGMVEILGVDGESSMDRLAVEYMDYNGDGLADNVGGPENQQMFWDTLTRLSASMKECYSAKLGYGRRCE